MAQALHFGDMIKATLANRSVRLTENILRNNAILRSFDTPESHERNRVLREEYFAEIALLAQEYGPPDMNARSWHWDCDEDY